MNALFYLAAFVLALGLLVTIHELGHFLVARLCGVRVLRFCVGFGKPILSRRFSPGGTEWALAAFPLGGYVKMLDEREGPVSPAELPFAFNRKSLIRRFAIVAAGPLANLLLAILLYWGIFLHGVEELRPILGPSVAGSLAAEAGFVEGDLVTSLNGNPVATWNEFRQGILQGALQKEELRIEVINAGREISLHRMDPARMGDVEGDAFQRLGFQIDRPQMPSVIGKVMEGGAGARAGLRVGDRVLGIEGRPVSRWSDLVGMVRESPGRELSFEVEREGTSFRLTVVPTPAREEGRIIGRIGVGAGEIPGDEREKRIALVRYGVDEAFLKAATQTWQTAVFSLRMMGRMITGDVSWRNLSGPVTIADYAGQSARMGLIPYVRFLALISISLGILNLLPVPILDGGHLMYYSVEAIKGSPVSARAMDIGQRVGLALIGMLMAFALYNDISRLLSF